MRIGIMCLASFGGSARIATELAVQLAGRGHQVHLFARTTPFGDSYHSTGLTLHTVLLDLENDIHPAKLDTEWAASDLRALLFNILEVIADEGLDVLHFHYAVPFAFVAAEVKRLLGWSAPLVIGTLHGTDVSIYGRLHSMGSELAEALYEIDELSTVSASHARLATEIFGLPTAPKVIPNFVDLTRFHPLQPVIQEPGYSMKRGPRKSEGSLRQRPKIAHVSNFRAVKDPTSMARIFLGIREQIDAELWLIGDGPEMEAVKSILEHSCYKDDICYWSLQRNVADLLAHADLLLMTSLSESFCLAALEAMACGVPVLATDVGGLPEVVLQGQTGFLFPVGDHQCAIQLGVGLLSDKQKHLTMCLTAARHARKFGYHRIVPAYEEMYADLLAIKSDGLPSRDPLRGYGDNP